MRLVLSIHSFSSEAGGCSSLRTLRVKGQKSWVFFLFWCSSVTHNPRPGTAGWGPLVYRTLEYRLTVAMDTCSSCFTRPNWLLTVCSSNLH